MLVIQGCSSVGRVLVSKTMGRGFESFLPCQIRGMVHEMYRSSFFVRGEVLEGETVVNDSLNGCQSRGRPSAQFARESSPEQTALHPSGVVSFFLRRQGLEGEAVAARTFATRMFAC